MFIDARFVLFLFSPYLDDFKSQVHCRSDLGPGASGLYYYCAPLVCVFDIIVWLFFFDILSWVWFLFGSFFGLGVWFATVMPPYKRIKKRKKGQKVCQPNLRATFRVLGLGQITCKQPTRANQIKLESRKTKEFFFWFDPQNDSTFIAMSRKSKWSGSYILIYFRRMLDALNRVKRDTGDQRPCWWVVAGGSTWSTLYSKSQGRALLPQNASISAAFVVAVQCDMMCKMFINNRKS